MRSLGFPIALVLVLLVGGTASAQEGKGWLGADVLDVTKAEANKHGWDSPHGAKLGVVASGSPAVRAGLNSVRPSGSYFGASIGQTRFRKWHDIF